MQATENERLIKVFPDLVNQVRPKDILPCLRQQDIFDVDDEERVMAATTTKDKMRVLLTLLPLRGPRAYTVFRQALITDYEWIVEDMDKIGIRSESDGIQPETRSHNQTVQRNVCTLKEINNKILRKVAHHPEVLRDWKTLARCLGLEEHDIVDIEFANQLSAKEASYQALLRWQTRKGKQATHSALVAGIRDSGFQHLADELEDES